MKMTSMTSNERGDDGVTTRRKANPELLSLFALSVLMSSSDVGEGANSEELVVFGESRTMQIPDSFHKVRNTRGGDSFTTS